MEPPAITNAFRQWLRSGPNMSLGNNRAVTRLSCEGITSFDTLADFDSESIRELSTICAREIPGVAGAAGPPVVAAIPAIPGANISSIAIRRLITAVHSAKYYQSIGRTMTTANMHYNNVLTTFKVEWDAYSDIKDEDEPKLPKLNDQDHDRKVIRWAPIFADHLSRCFGSRGPLRYVIRDEAEVPDEIADPLQANSYFGASGNLQEELVARLPHTGPIYQQDNKTVYMKIEEAVRGTSVESTLKGFSRRKDGRAAFFALISNHADESKYRTISKKKMTFLQTVKWTGRAYPFETHVTNHRAAFDDLRDCSTHVTVNVPNDAQRVDYLLDSVACQDAAFQAAMGLVRANTNGARENFEEASRRLIEVCPYKRSTRGKGTQREGNISAIDFAGGRGDTGVDLRWHAPEDFKALPDEQKDELSAWLKTTEGAKHKLEAKKELKKNKKRKYAGHDNYKGNKKQNNNKTFMKKLKQKMKTAKGAAAIMSVVSEEEKSNANVIAALQAHTAAKTAAPVSSANTATTVSAATGTATIGAATAEAFPATSAKAQAIIARQKRNPKGE